MYTCIYVYVCMSIYMYVHMLERVQVCVEFMCRVCRICVHVSLSVRLRVAAIRTRS